MLRHFVHKIAVLAVAAGALALPGKAAHADLKFTNYYQTPVYVAIGWYDPYACGDISPWRAKGWYRIGYRETVTLWSGKLTDTNNYWYYYAESEGPVYLASKRYWEGPYEFLVNDTDAFDICDSGGPGLSPRYGFKEIIASGRDDIEIPLF
jgi:uncharacterized membrane protein